MTHIACVTKRIKCGANTHHSSEDYATSHVAIIGAGILGLTLAHRLSRANCKVSVLEEFHQPGGLATWHHYGDFSWDKFYHVILPSDTHLLDLIEELGISNQLRWRTTKTGFLWDGQLLSMSNNWELLTFPALSLVDKVRLAAGVLYCRRMGDGSRLDGIAAAEWLPRVFGRRVYESIWDSLLRAKFGPLRAKAPANLLRAAIKRGYSARSRRNGREKMGYLCGGMKTLIDALTASITANGGTVRYNCRVGSIDGSKRPLVAVRSSDNQEREFDHVISTLPTALFQNVVSAESGLTLDGGKAPDFLGVICVALVLRRPLTPYYVINLIHGNYPFTGIIEATNVVSSEELSGNHLVFLPRYDTPESKWFDYEPDSIAESFLSALRPMWPDIDDNVVSWIVHRKKFVQPVWAVGTVPRRKPTTNSLGNVISVNAELAGSDTLSNNALIRLAGKILPKETGYTTTGNCQDRRVCATASTRGDTTTSTGRSTSTSGSTSSISK